MTARRIIEKWRYRTIPDAWLKLKMLRVYGFQIREWRDDVWRNEPWARMCCDGRECGCYGSCWGDWWEHLLREKCK